ncbi:MAG: glycosyltransferase family 4 protein [Lactobacillaceae bacterium]|nr:glycosyltransferase family 4 protein [Lactobacillaceae bacterium]
MNIGLFTDTYFPQVSGVSTSVKVLSDELNRQGHRVYIFTTTDPGVKKSEYGVGDEKYVYRFSSVPFTGFKDRRVAVRGFFNVVEIARALRLDVVHTQTEFSLGIMGKFVARQLKIPIVHTYHTNYADYTHYVMDGRLIKPENVKTIVRSFLHNFNAVIAPSEDTKEVLESYQIKAPILVIPTGISFPKNQADKTKNLASKFHLKNKKVILSLGRIAYEKNLNTLVDNFYQISKDYPNAVLMFVGDGPARADLEKQVQDYQIDDRVIFVGMVDHSEIYSYYKLADVFISLSTTETQGLTFIESLDAGTPFIAYPNDFLKSITKNKSVGILADTTAKFIKAIRTYLDNDQYKKDDAGRQKAIKSVSAETFANSVHTLYAKAIVNYHKPNSVLKTLTVDEKLYVGALVKKIPSIIKKKRKADEQ